MKRRLVFKSVLLPLFTCFIGNSVIASEAISDYPSKPIKIVVPFSPGGGTSNAARMIGEKITEKLGQPVIIENRPGGNTVIGATQVAKSPADGYTLFFANSSFSINPGLMTKLPYDSEKDFVPVSPLLVNQFVILTHPSTGINSLQELIKEVKTNPEKYPYPSVGATGIGRIANEIFNQKIGVKLVNVPYKGTGQLATDLMGGQVKYAIEIPGVYISHIQAGKLKALAVTGNKRLASLPDVPTFSEAGLDGFDISSWYGILAPTGTPSGVVEKLNTTIQDILKSDDIRQKLEAIEAEPLIGGSNDFSELIKKDTQRFQSVIKDAQIKVE